MKETYNDNDSVFHGWYLLLIFINTITIYQDSSVCFNMKINPLWYCHLISPYLRISAYVKWQILCMFCKNWPAVQGQNGFIC